MKKTYIFLTFAIYGIGGTQIYVRNKMRFLEDRGWGVKVVTTEIAGNNPLVIEELSPFEGLVFPELLKNPNLFTKKERMRILKRISTAIGPVSPDSVIEPNFIQVTFWGELLAEHLGIRNFIFLIQEDYRIRIRSYLYFFKYKLDRGEFFVNTRFALRQLFDGYIDVSEGTDSFLSATCHNAVEDCDSQFVEKLPNADYIIGMIGRVNKPFVLPVIREIVRYSACHSEHTFVLMLLGGSSNEHDYAAIDQAVGGATNLQIMITGPIFPVPYQMIKRGNVFISSAGSVRTSADCGMITIAIDANDFQPIGIFGYTTQEYIHRPPNADIIPLHTLLDQVLFEKKYINNPVFLSEWEDIEKSFENHLIRLQNAKSILQYYDIGKIYPAIGLILQECKNRICKSIRK